MITQVAIEGIDGSGKTSVAAALADEFTKDGLKPAVYAPFRLANDKLGHDIYELWRTPDTALEAVEVLHEVLDECQEMSRDEEVDVTIYDRHWMTAVGEIIHDADALDVWGDYFVPTALLRVNPQLATQRQANDLSADWSTLQRQKQAANLRTCLSKRYSEHMLGVYRSDADVSVKALARSIQSDMRFRR